MCSFVLLLLVYLHPGARNRSRFVAEKELHQSFSILHNHFTMSIEKILSVFGSCLGTICSCTFRCVCLQKNSMNVVPVCSLAQFGVCISMHK